MARMDTGDRLLLLLSMMTLGCPGDDGDDAADEGSDTTTGSTSSPGMTSVDQDTTGDTTAAADSTSDGGTTMSVATGATSDGSTDGDSGDSGDSTSGDSGDESTTSVEPPSPFVEACAASYGAYLECVGENGYTDEQLLALCTQYEGYLEMYYGGECLGLQTEFLACLSELTCQEFMSIAPEGEACSEEYVTGNATCPELFSFCTGGGGGGGDGSCMIEATGCLDGNEYAVQCNATTCQCLTNGTPSGSFDSPGADSCLDDGFGDMAEMACGFPQGIFF